MIHDARIEKFVTENQIVELDRILTEIDDPRTLELARRLTLFSGTRENNTAAIECALKHGADINTPSYYGTPLVVSFEYESNDSFDFLIKNGANLNAISYGGKTVLDATAEIVKEAQRERRPKLLKLRKTLAEKGAISTSELDSAPVTIQNIADAVYENYKQDIRDLIKSAKKTGTEIMVKHLITREAASQDNVKILELMLDSGENIDGMHEFEPLIFHAAYDKSISALELLIEKGANLNLTDRDGGTVLDRINQINGCQKIKKKLIEKGAKTSLELHEKCLEFELDDMLFLSIDTGEPWSNLATKYIKNLDREHGLRWIKLLQQCSSNHSSKLGSKWLKDTEKLIQSIGPVEFKEHALKWLEKLPLGRTSELYEYQIGTNEPHYFENSYDEYLHDRSHVFSDKNTRIVKCIFWLLSSYHDKDVARALRTVAEQMYKKVPGIGIRNTTMANAATTALSLLPDTLGVPEIIYLKTTTKYRSSLDRINKIFYQIAEEKDLSPNQLMENFSSSDDLTSLGEYRKKIGSYEAKVTITGPGKSDLTWLSEEKSQKTIPAPIKDKFEKEINKLKISIKEINKSTSAQNHRLESLLLQNEALDFLSWNTYYIEHKLIAPLARKLIWRMSEGDSHTDIIFYQDHFVDAQLQPITINQQASFRLWHPSMSSPEEILNWRNLLFKQEITQPFKQAHREIYLLTDAERATHDHSLRFANHAIKQAQFHALAQQRGWNQQRGGGWDGGQDTSASKHYKDYGITAYFNAQGIDLMTTISNVYSLCETESVEFFTKGNKVALEDVPSLLFSEVMRDVDLFVGVASIGNDPAWQDRNDEHWLLGSFGELSNTAITRKEVLSALIPKLKISDRLSLEGRFLRVQGDLTAYKIHLGSSNILMEPDDSYLCIVSTRKKSNVLLPFEGDNTLSLILSKAMLLAEDSKIKDSTILSQIKRTA